MRIARTLLLMTAVTLPGLGTPAQAWGPAGHQAAAEVAARRLTAAAQKEAAALLRGRTMAEVSVWADEARNTTHPQTGSWHFINIPISATGFNRARDCRGGTCIVAAIERLEAVLRDRTRPRVEREEALRFLIHLVADVHQPMHAADAADRGGNDRAIAQIGGALNLHAAWDSGIIQAQNVSAVSLAAAANRWLATQVEARIAAGSAAEWALETFRVGRDLVYPQVKGDNAITGAERQQAMRAIEERIARSGVRLAAMLNRALPAR